MNDQGRFLAVTNAQALRFFFERLRDVVHDDGTPQNELVYNASVLAHFASTSTASTTDFPACPTSLTTVFDAFVLDRSQHHDPEIVEAAASQCLLLTGFFQDQLRRRHNIEWYAGLGAKFYGSAAQLSRNPARAPLLAAMARRFGFWRRQYRRLAVEFRDDARLIRSGPA